MEVGALVRSADDHHKVAIGAQQALVAYWRLEQMPVVVDPLLKVERRRDHGVPARSAAHRAAGRGPCHDRAMSHHTPIPSENHVLMI